MHSGPRHLASRRYFFVLFQLGHTLLNMAASAIGLSGCTVCREPITGQVISALAHKMHADCFAYAPVFSFFFLAFLLNQSCSCAQCLNPFDGAKFFEKENRLYCESDYQALFGARCARCGETITTKSVTALDMKWHPEVRPSLKI